MNYTISLILDVVYCETSERYCSDVDDMSQVSFCVFFEHRGSVNFELGSSKLSCASTGEHAERSASRSRYLKSRNVVFTSVMFYCVFLSVTGVSTVTF